MCVLKVVVLIFAFTPSSYSYLSLQRDCYVFTENLKDFESTSLLEELENDQKDIRLQI